MSILIPRSGWGAKYGNGFAIIGTREWEAAGKETWLHHSVTNPPGPDASFEEDCAHMRLIEQIGQTNFGGGISYTAVVMPSGRGFEGHSLDRQGAHTSGRNNRSRAICLAGNYDVAVPDGKILGTVALILREWGCELDGGHRDVYPTACPGQHAYARIASINEAARSGAPIEGDEMSAADAHNGVASFFAELASDSTDPAVEKAREDGRKVLFMYGMPKAPDQEITDENRTTIHDEMRWLTPNLNAIAAAVAKLQASVDALTAKPTAE